MTVPTTVAFPEALPAERRKQDWYVESDGVEVKLTNLAKPYWKPEGYTKGDLVTFYWNIAPWILPYLADRALTLKRMPEGADGPFFYAKNAPPGAPDWLRRQTVVSDGDDKRIDYLVAETRADLLWLANAGCIELHPWHSRVDRIGAPDYAFFDLDPMNAATFDDVAQVARYVGTALERLGIRGYPRTSGATGMQVYVPLDRVHSAGTVREWVGRVFALIHQVDPERTTMTWDVARRGDAVFLDHNMNTEGRNIAATYCLRPERGAPMATPLTWDEVEAGVAPTDFTIATVWERLARTGDLFAPVLQGGQDLRTAMPAVGMPADDQPEARHFVVPAKPRRAARRPSGRAGAVQAPPGELATYEAMRDFAVTPEPAPDGAPPDPAAPPASGPRFVIQHHLATRLHHDLRLEQGGTGRSWALPKGLPEVPGLPHRAIQTEDHPLSYFSFAGTIPKGEYGGGEVRIWDRGTYEALEWHDGKVTVRLHGVRHTGEYHLFRSRAETPKDWLVTAAHARPAPPPPPELAPMLAGTADAPFDDDGWMFELKWDGIRAITTVTRPGFGGDGSTRFVSRQGNDVTPAYPELADLWERVLAYNAVLDGEIVALGPDGRPSFELLQQRMHLREPRAVERISRLHPVTFVAFDLLAVDGEPLIDRPLEERTARLEALLVPDPPRIVRSETILGSGTAMFEAVTAQDLEGLVAKRLGSTYRPGRRSPEWRKIKVRRNAEVVIGGWLPGEGNRAGTLGALLVGFFDDDQLRYAGRVGTGFDDAELRRLLPILRDHASDAAPFADVHAMPVEARRRGVVRWTRPDLVCQVEYGERTEQGRLRAPSYKGLRDTDPTTVTAP